MSLESDRNIESQLPEITDPGEPLPAITEIVTNQPQSRPSNIANLPNNVIQAISSTFSLKLSNTCQKHHQNHLYQASDR